MAKHGRHIAHGGRPESMGDAVQVRGEGVRGQQPRHARGATGVHGARALSASSGSGFYGRENYGSDATGAYARPVPKRGGIGKRVAIAVAIILGACVVAAAAYALWYSSALNDALAPSQATREAVDEELVSAPLDKPFYMLLLGSDSREGTGTSTNASEQGDQERSDVIMLARIDAPNKQVTLVSIPRDTPYTFDDGRVAKINETYNVGGPALTIKAVSELTGVSISHYASVHVSELEAIVDTLGGIEVHVDRRLRVRDALTNEVIVIRKGTQTLNGQQAQAFVRARHEYSKDGESQDGSRQSNVRTFTQAVIKKVLDRPVVELPGVILELAAYVETDLTAGDLVSLGLAFAGGDPTIYNCTGPIDGYTAEEYGGIWLCYPNPEGWAELMRQVDAGLEPGEIDYESTQIIPDSVRID